MCKNAVNSIFDSKTKNVPTTTQNNVPSWVNQGSQDTYNQASGLNPWENPFSDPRGAIAGLTDSEVQGYDVLGQRHGQEGYNIARSATNQGLNRNFGVSNILGDSPYGASALSDRESPYDGNFWLNDTFGDDPRSAINGLSDSIYNPQANIIDRQLGLNQRQAGIDAALSGSTGGSRSYLSQLTNNRNAADAKANAFGQAQESALRFYGDQDQIRQGHAFAGDAADRGFLQEQRDFLLRANELGRVESGEDFERGIALSNLERAMAQEQGAGLVAGGEAGRGIEQARRQYQLDNAERARADQYNRINARTSVLSNTPFNRTTKGEQVVQTPSILGQIAGTVGAVGSFYGG